MEFKMKATFPDRTGNGTHEVEEVVTNPSTINVYKRYGYDFVKPPTKTEMTKALVEMGLVEGKQFTSNNVKQVFDRKTSDK